jgi:RNA polymerase sigma factor (sigma-70 family)
MLTVSLTFEELYSTYHGPVLHFLAQQFHFSSQDCEDVAQSTFFKAWRALPQLPHSDIVSWLYCIARHCAIDLLRGQAARREQAMLSMFVGHDEWLGEAPDQTEMAGRYADMLQAVRRLPVAYRRALLYSAEGYSLQDIMSVMQCSHGRARMLVYRARQMVRQSVQEAVA